jgi:hypothetical protein
LVWFRRTKFYAGGMDPTKALELAREHEAELDGINAQIADLKQKADALSGIIAGYHAYAGANKTRGAKPAPRERNPWIRRAGAPGLKRVLESMLREWGELSIDKALDELAKMPAWKGRMPSRNTVGSRFGDLSREGKARSDGQGTYTWTGDSRNGSNASASQLEGLSA